MSTDDLAKYEALAKSLDNPFPRDPRPAYFKIAEHITELVEMVREWKDICENAEHEHGVAAKAAEAADLIERQAKAMEEAEKALEPFVVPRDAAHAGARTDDSVAFEIDGHELKVGDFRRARAALAAIRAARGEKE